MRNCTMRTSNHFTGHYCMKECILKRLLFSLAKTMNVTWSLSSQTSHNIWTCMQKTFPNNSRLLPRLQICINVYLQTLCWVCLIYIQQKHHLAGGTTSLDRTRVRLRAVLGGSLLSRSFSM